MRVVIPRNQALLPAEQLQVSWNLFHRVAGKYDCLIVAANGFQLICRLELNKRVNGWRKWCFLSVESISSAGRCHRGPFVRRPDWQHEIGNEADGESGG